MLTRIQELKEKRDAGFTLIELLVVVAIIGILAAIAIPVFLNQRNSARDAGVKSDIDSTAKQMETYYTQNNAYPTAAADLTSLPISLKLSPGNGVAITMNGASAYTITGCNNESLQSYTYDSAGGGLSSTATAVTACTPGLTLG